MSNPSPVAAPRSSHDRRSAAYSSHSGHTGGRGPTGGRRILIALAALAAAALATLTPTSPAAADATTTPTANATPTIPNLGPQTAGTKLCQISDSDLDNVTGMVATQGGIYAVQGGPTYSSLQIWTINSASCLSEPKSYGFQPFDPQDLALGSDGALWVADTGLAAGDRERVAVERVDPNARTNAVPYRILNPATGQINALAVLLQADNTPIIIANSGGKAVLYKPDGPLKPTVTEDLPTLQKVGDFTPVNTGTPNPKGGFGWSVVTGAAVSPDRKFVVLRTMSDAYEFTVGSDGDLVKAITGGNKPVITPLPDEENGQAISYTADGSKFLTLSAASKATLRSYARYVPPAPTVAPAATSGGSKSLSFSDITNIAAVVGFLGLVAVVVGVVGIVRARRLHEARLARARRSGRRDDEDDQYGTHDPYADDDVDADQYATAQAGHAPRQRGGAAGGRGGKGGGKRVPEAAPAPRGTGRARVAGPGAPGAGPGVGGPGPSGAPGPAPSGGRGRGATYGTATPSGQVYGGQAPVPGQPPGAGQPYGAGQSYGGGGQSYAAGQTPGAPSGGVQGSGNVYGSGAVYGGRPRPEDDEDGQRRGGYGRDNVDI